MIFKSVLSIFFILDLSNVFAGEALSFDKSKISFVLPPNFTARKNNNNHACFTLFRKLQGKSISAADACFYPDGGESKMKAAGFNKYISFPENSISFEKPISGFVYASPMSVYPADIVHTSVGDGYTASNVDCDLEGTQPMYRATGTCDTAFILLTDHSGLYINFAIRNNVKKLSISTHNDFMYVVKSLRDTKKN